MSDQANFILNCGDKVKDRITGFEGIITARADHLNGCNRYHVAPPMDKKTGAIPESYWIDEADLIVVKKSTFGKQTPEKRERGGFMARDK